MIENNYGKEEVGTHIRFVPIKPNPKTLVWAVTSDDFSMILGQISWYGPWRKYSFRPKPYTVFEQVCLREISDFCERKTREHKQQRASASSVDATAGRVSAPSDQAASRLPSAPLNPSNVEPLNHE